MSPHMSPQLYSLQNQYLRISALDYGARLISIEYLHDGVWRQCLRTLSAAEDYLSDNESMGATVGRYANRIGAAEFVLNGERFHLSKNEGNHCLHGGRNGFAKKFWRVTATGQLLRFHYFSPDGEEGFPGNLDVWLDVSLDGPTVRLDFSAQSDADTIVSLTSHGYFNLAASSTDVGQHQLTVASDYYLPVTEEKLPTGSLDASDGTPFDFRRGVLISQALAMSHPQLDIGQGIDHCLVLHDRFDYHARLAADGVYMDVITSAPGLQVYTANHSKIPRSAVCLEPQCYPDSPNNSDFPSSVLRAHERQHMNISYRFGDL